MRMLVNSKHGEGVTSVSRFLATCLLALVAYGGGGIADGTAKAETYGGFGVGLVNYDVPAPPRDIIEAQTADRRGTGIHAYVGVMTDESFGIEAFYTDLGEYSWTGDATGLTLADISPAAIGVAGRLVEKGSETGGEAFVRFGLHSYSATLTPTNHLFALACPSGNPPCPSRDEGGVGALVGVGGTYNAVYYGVDYYTGANALMIHVGVHFAE